MGATGTGASPTGNTEEVIGMEVVAIDDKGPEREMTTAAVMLERDNRAALRRGPVFCSSP